MAEPPTRQQPMTAEEAALLHPDEQAGELDAGRWVPVTRNTWKHGMIVGNAYAVLRTFAKEHPGWSVSVGDPGTVLGRDPDILRGPDVAVVRKEREPTGQGVDGWLAGAPDVAVEVVGDRQSPSDLMKKSLEYLAAGAGMVWILDPEPQRLILLEPKHQVHVLDRHETLDGGEVLPGFSCPVSELFE